MSSRFESIVSKLPYSWERILGQGLSFFIREQEPEQVKWEVILDDGEVVGWSVKVKTDKENTEDAKEFWERYVDPRLGGK